METKIRYFNKGGKENSKNNIHSGNGRLGTAVCTVALAVEGIVLAIGAAGCGDKYKISAPPRDAIADHLDVNDPRDADPDVVDPLDASIDVNSPRDAEPDVPNYPDSSVDADCPDSYVVDSTVEDAEVVDAEIPPDAEIVDAEVDAEIDAGPLCPGVSNTSLDQTVEIGVGTVEVVNGIAVRYVQIDPNHMLSPTWAYVDLECAANGYIFEQNTVIVENAWNPRPLPLIGHTVSLHNNWAVTDLLNVTVRITSP